MLKKLLLIFIFIVFVYVITYFVNMHQILKLNSQAEELALEIEILREEYLVLISEYNYLRSREYLAPIAESLGMYMPEDFDDYAFYQEVKNEAGKKDLILLQLLSPTAEAMSTTPPSQLR